MFLDERSIREHVLDGSLDPEVGLHALINAYGEHLDALQSAKAEDAQLRVDLSIVVGAVMRARGEDGPSLVVGPFRFTFTRPSTGKQWKKDRLDKVLAWATKHRDETLPVAELIEMLQRCIEPSYRDGSFMIKDMRKGNDDAGNEAA